MPFVILSTNDTSILITVLEISDESGMDKKKGKSSHETIVEDGMPEAKYTRFGERIRQAIPGPMQCSVGCGGRNCKWENPARWSDADQAIKGVFSSWVLEDVVAMSRPSTGIIKQYKMIEQFKKHKIRSIINLQRPGEHASCGPPLDKESLFTYRPQEFMDNNVFFYNFGWKDYGVTSLHTILDMVKVMSFALEEGKVAVHCHAGLGRTGVLIACYLVYAERMDPGSAILRVRKNRSNSIQTRGQIACITEFYQFLRPLRIVFPQVVPHAKRLTLKQFLTRQRHLLHGFESRELRHTPKLIHVICERLTYIAQIPSDKQHQAGVETSLKRCNTVAEIKESLPGAFVNETTEEIKHECEPVLEFLSHSPTDVEAVLSPRVLRRGSARSVSSTDMLTRPQSAGDVPLEQEDNVFVPVSSSSGKETSLDNGQQAVYDDIKVDSSSESFQTLPSSDLLNDVKDDNRNSTREENLSIEGKKDSLSNESQIASSDIPDEQLDRDVNEILGYNSNNSHSLIDTQINSISSKLRRSDIDRDSVDVSTTSKISNPSSEEENSPRTQHASKPTTADTESDQGSQPTSTLRKMRHSAGRSEKILPTGLPSKNPRNSAKGRRPSSGILPANFQLDDEEDILEPEISVSPRDSDALAVEDSVISAEAYNTDTPEMITSATSSQATETVTYIKSDTNLVLPSRSIASKQNHKVASSVNDSSNGSSLKSRPMLTLIDDPVWRDVDPQMEDEDIEKLQETSHSILPSTELQSTSSNPPNDLQSTGDTDNIGDGSADDVPCAVSESGEEELVQEIFENQTEEEQRPLFKVGPTGTDDDDNLDEIIDIGFGDDLSSVDSDSESEEVDTERTNSSAKLSQSVASKVSWSQMKINVEEETRTDEDGRVVSAASGRSQQGGRKTPLMYRAEKNIHMMEGDTDQAENPVSKNSEKTDSSSSDEELTEDVNLELSVDVTELNTNENNSNESENNPPVLASHLTVKSPVIARINATKSLNDLASASHEDPILSYSRCSSSGDMRHPSPHGLHVQPDRTNPTNVGLAIAYKLIDDEWLWEKVYSLQIEVNNRNEAWANIAEVTDAYLLACLMWSWIEHLAEPILTKNDVHQLLSIINRPGDTISTESSYVVTSFEKALASLEPGTSTTTKCLLTCILSFPSLPKRITESMIRRTVAALTQTTMSSSGSPEMDSNLEQAFQDYVNAKYEVSGKKRFLIESKEKSPRLPSERTTRQPSSTDSESSSEGPDNADADEIVRRSAGSVHSSASSGSNNTGNVVMAAPGIVVN